MTSSSIVNRHSNSARPQRPPPDFSLDSKPSSDTDSSANPPVWWSNVIFFVAVHLIGIYGAVFISPFHKVSRPTIVLTVISWQLATFGITIGYHRLWSHKSFRASPGLRIILSLMGSLGFQGSIKWWVLRHRLHHRWTDSEFDPYNSKKGLFFSHMGWIFRKPRYEKLELINRSDLDHDPVVKFQHKHYVPISLFVGFILPHLLSEFVLRCNQNSSLDGIIWAGFVSRIMIWHFTFLINSFAHYYGDRHFDLDISARSNFLLAIFTGGEANHNYHHVFPKDYRNGPAYFDWDPSKWIIYLLHRYTNLVSKLNYTDPVEVEQVRQRVLKITSSRRKNGRPSHFEDIHHISLLSSSSSSSSDIEAEIDGEEMYNLARQCHLGLQLSESLKPKVIPRWPKDEMLFKLLDYHENSSTFQHIKSNQGLELMVRMREKASKLNILVIGSYLIDITNYLNSAQHPGGNQILRKFQLNLTCLEELRTFIDQSAISTINETNQIDREKKGPLLSLYSDFDQFKDLIQYNDCYEEFMFNLNMHSNLGVRKMKGLRIAKLIH